jgi:TetR/AcrR family transcriptional repressor of multidrug resistance operon
MRPKNLEMEKSIRTVALQIIAEEGLENLSMQKLAKAVNISPRTIYIKYENKEDLLIKLFIEEVLGAYERAALENFDPNADFAEGVEKLWSNVFNYLKNNKHAFALIQHGKSSPLLNKAYKDEGIRQGDHFKPVHQFLKRQAQKGTISDFPIDVHRALLFAPLFDLVTEYFDHQERSKQIITKTMLTACCQAVIKGMLK